MLKLNAEAEGLETPAGFIPSWKEERGRQWEEQGRQISDGHISTWGTSLRYAAATELRMET